MKKIIVTGGLGFIGSNLIDLLISKNYFVINVDKVTYSSNFYNIREFRNSKRYKFLRCDINDKKFKNFNCLNSFSSKILFIKIIFANPNISAGVKWKR